MRCLAFFFTLLALGGTAFATTRVSFYSAQSCNPAFLYTSVDFGDNLPANQRRCDLLSRSLPFVSGIGAVEFDGHCVFTSGTFDDLCKQWAPGSDPSPGGGPQTTVQFYSAGSCNSAFLYTSVDFGENLPANQRKCDLLAQSLPFVSGIGAVQFDGHCALLSGSFDDLCKHFAPGSDSDDGGSTITPVEFFSAASCNELFSYTTVNFGEDHDANLRRCDLLGQVLPFVSGIGAVKFAGNCTFTQGSFVQVCDQFTP
jgi:hypothetical protein